MNRRYNWVGWMFMLLLIFVSFDHCFAKRFDDKEFKFFQWTNPTPKFADFGFDLEELVKIVGNSQMLISHKGMAVDLWTNTGKSGEVKHYENARFVTGIGIINKPRQELINYYMDFDRYTDVMEQITEAEIIKSEKNQHLVRLKQVYKVTILSLVADFRYLYTQEPNGDLSILLLDGDVGAGVNRTEFISLDENRTLVAVTQWLDLENAKFVYRTMIKAQPDIKPTAPVAASAMLGEQFKMYLERQDGKSTTPEDMSELPRVPVIPKYVNGNISVDTFHRLSDLGTLVFVHPEQWIQTEDGPKSVQFVSAGAQIAGNIEDVRPISSDFRRFPEYFDQAKKIRYREDNDITVIDWHFKFGFGIVGVGIDYSIKVDWQNENFVVFEGVKGDIDPLYGAWEWIDLSQDKTLILMTSAMQIGDDASWLLKLGNKVPSINIIGPIFMGTLAVEKQAKWLESQIRKGDDLAVK